MTDPTTARVRSLLHGEYLSAHPELQDARRRTINIETDPAYFCVCGHHAHCHYGDLGQNDCGEPGCTCQRWRAAE